MAAAIPYVSANIAFGGIQTYGCMMLLAVTAAALTAVLTRRRFELGDTDVAILVPVAIAAASCAAMSSTSSRINGTRSASAPSYSSM